MTVTPQTNCALQDIAARMLELDDFVICGHVSPDGDCLGSQLALAAALEQLNKHVTCVLVKDEPIEANLGRVLVGSDKLLFAGEFSGAVGTFVGVDVPTRERIGEHACALLDQAEFSITIDHHAVDDTMCDMVYVDPDAASTTLLIWQLAGYLGVKRQGAVADCCYTGLVTDTGRFQYQNTDARAMAFASEMVSEGANPAAVSREVFQNRTYASMQLEATAVLRTEFGPQKRFALGYLTLEDFKRFGAQKSDAEPVINALRCIEGVSVACMLREQDDCIRGSLRAKDDVDVSAIARGFGGGGHVAAAGFTMHCSLDDARSQVRAALLKAVSAE